MKFDTWALRLHAAIKSKGYRLVELQELARCEASFNRENEIKDSPFMLLVLEAKINHTNLDILKKLYQLQRS